MKAALTAIAFVFAGMVTQASAQQCVSVNNVISKADEFKRPYAYLAKGDLLTALAAIYAAQTNNYFDPDRAMVIEVNGSIIVGILHGADICGFLMIHDPDMADAIRLAAFGTTI